MAAKQNTVCFRTLHLDQPWSLDSYRSVGGYLAAELKDGSVRVYSLTYRKQIMADGSFGDLQVHGVGSSYLILARNVDA